SVQPKPFRSTAMTRCSFFSTGTTGAHTPTDDAKPWISTTGGPSPSSITCTRAPAASTNRAPFGSPGSGPWWNGVQPLAAASKVAATSAVMPRGTRGRRAMARTSGREAPHLGGVVELRGELVRLRHHAGDGAETL